MVVINMAGAHGIKITFLGTAANGGIPQADCRCLNCRSKLIVRKRSSLLLETDNKKVIIDCGPDFHSQLIENGLRLQDLSGIVISHLHWDHSAGLFDLSSGKTLNIPIFVHPKIKRVLKSNNTFNFIFEKHWAKFSHIQGFDVKFLEISHDPNFLTFAIKISNGGKQILIATDIFTINKIFLKEAKNSDLIIFDSTFLNESKHWHLSIRESAQILSKLTKNVIFTHINHSENPNTIKRFLQKFGFKLAFDGMVIKI